mmetsp:Transcript_22289/g.40150  ORF Transcript_22289/g.40150 Transcript_22289/m.40150 type:complete len:173 (+) Transcript_22289:263-781(+)
MIVLRCSAPRLTESLGHLQNLQARGLYLIRSLTQEVRSTKTVPDTEVRALTEEARIKTAPAMQAMAWTTNEVKITKTVPGMIAETRTPTEEVSVTVPDMMAVLTPTEEVRITQAVEDMQAEAWTTKEVWITKTAVDMQFDASHLTEGMRTSRTMTVLQALDAPVTMTLIVRM